MRYPRSQRKQAGRRAATEKTGLKRYQDREDPRLALTGQPGCGIAGCSTGSGVAAGAAPDADRPAQDQAILNLAVAYFADDLLSRDSCGLAVCRHLRCASRN